MSSTTQRKRHAGERIGRLVLVEPVRVGNRVTKWVCDCNCGNRIEVAPANLCSLNTRSCGCLRVESCLKREHEKNHPTHSVVFNYYRRNAKLRGLAWALSDDIFKRLVSGDCHYCGSPPAERVLARYGYRKSFVYNGIDRLENSVGYTPGNCVSCCSTCNYAKRDMDSKDFITWAIKLADHQRTTA